MVAFITSKEGKIDDFSKIIIFKYNFSEFLNKNNDQKNKFIKWLSKNLPVYNIEQNSFNVLSPMETKENSQYKLDSENKLSTPTVDTQIISTYLGHIIKNSLKKTYAQYLNDNTFVVEKIDFSPFVLLKCFSFNVEYFNDGIFYIHFLPESKIVSKEKSTTQYFRELKVNSKNHSQDNDLIINLIDLGNYKRQEINLSEQGSISQVEQFLLKKRGDVIATFNYHFIAQYSPQIFKSITEKMEKNLTESVSFLEPISKKIIFPEFITLTQKPFLKIEISNLANKNNLIVGSNKTVKKQSAAFYDGIFRSVDNKIIQPLAVGDTSDYFLMFCDQLKIFNKDGKNSKLKKLINLPTEKDIDIGILKNLKKQFGDNLLLAIFTKNTLSNDFFKALKNLKISRQVYKPLKHSNKSMSNFVVSCLTRLGGILDVIKDTHEPETTYFVGIDLGHTTFGNEKFSNLATVFFDNEGLLIYSKVSKRIKRNEALAPEAVGGLLKSFLNFIKLNSMPMPKKFIFHRDGRTHKTDINNICEQTKKYFDVENIDIVEVIKSGFPIIAGYDNGKYTNLDSGCFWIPKDRQYALLITNTQIAKEENILSPIIIKQKYGTTIFSHIVDQIYWFTKVYTNNLYNSTRLPATTEKANSLARTGNDRYYASYLA